VGGGTPTPTPTPTPPPDSEPPTWPGTAGVESATRTGDGSTAIITWYQAQDNVTAAGNIVYNIYYKPKSVLYVGPFDGSPEKSVTGVLSTSISGLNPDITYEVGVRAEDENNNEEANTRAIELDPLPNAVGSHWALYE
jgi:hypothetical protein